MRAIIHQVAGRQGVAALPVAGRSLIVRQVQWLRAIGCERIAVEIDSHPSSERIAEWLAEDGSGVFVDLVLTPRPMGPREVARRVGVAPGTPFLAVPADVLGGGDLPRLFGHADGGGVDVDLEPPRSLRRVRGATVALYGSVHAKRTRVVGPGWGAHISTFRDAHKLGILALARDLSGPGDVYEPTIHAAEITPGVWVGRGADVSPRAESVAPVLVGAGACVAAGARVGPGVVVAERAVIEADAVVENAYVSASVVVEDARVIRDGNLTEDGIRGLTAPPCASLVPGAIASRDAGPGAVERTLALVMLVALAPIAAAAALGRFAARARIRTGVVALVVRLSNVVRGRVRLVGAGAALGIVPGASPALLRDAALAPVGAIDIEAALSPPDADSHDRLRARAWYGAAKSMRLDGSLVRRTLMAHLSGHVATPMVTDELPRRIA